MRLRCIRRFRHPETSRVVEPGSTLDINDRVARDLVGLHCCEVVKPPVEEVQRSHPRQAMPPVLPDPSEDVEPVQVEAASAEAVAPEPSEDDTNPELPTPRRRRRKRG